RGQRLAAHVHHAGDFQRDARDQVRPRRGHHLDHGAERHGVALLGDLEAQPRLVHRHSYRVPNPRATSPTCPDMSESRAAWRTICSTVRVCAPSPTRISFTALAFCATTAATRSTSPTMRSD